MRKAYRISPANPKIPKSESRHPVLKSLSLLICIIAFTEFIVMMIIHKLNLPMLLEAFVDSCILAAMLVPIFYQYLGKRKEAEDKLNESRNQIEKIFEGSGDSMRIVVKNFKVMKVNAEMDKMSRLSKKKQIGMHCYNHLSSKYCGTKNCTLKRIMSGASRISEEILKTRDNGSKFWTEDTATPFTDVNGNIIGMIESFRDITERKEAEKKLKNQLAELERWEKLTIGRELKMIELKKKIKEMGSKIKDSKKS